MTIDIMHSFASS